MDRQTPWFQPTPGATALVAVSLIVVLMPAAIGRIMGKPQTKQVIYQDENGAATIESQRRADATGRSASVQAFTIGSVGLALAAIGVLREPPTAFNMGLDTAILYFLSWILLSAQAAYVVQASTCTGRYKISQSAILSSVIATICFILTKNGRENLMRNGLLNCGLLLGFAAALARVPSQPTLYKADREILNRHGSSLLSWFTFSYGFLHRSSAANLPEKLSLQSVPAVDFELRAKTLHAGILYDSLNSVLQTIILDKFMRKEVGNGESPKDNAESKHSKAAPAHNATFQDTQSIARAVLDNYYFPMAAFKVVLDIFYLTQLLSVKSLLAGALFPLLTTLLSKSLAQQHQVLQRSQTISQRKTIASLTEMLQNLHPIRLSSLETFWNRRLGESIAGQQRLRWATSMALEKLNFFSSLGPILLASVSISVHALEAGSLSPAVAFTALSFFSNLQGVFAQLPAKAAILHKSWISVQDLQEYLQQPDQERCAVAADELFLEEASIAWPGASATKDTAGFRLTNVTLRFPKQGLSVIVGKVGSGKSLLLAALLDEASVTAGRLGRPRLGEAETNSIVSGSTAYVSQPPWVINSSIRDNIVFGYPFDAERYERVLKACALDHDLAALEDGDRTVAGTGGSALSGGQKWRIALGRAFYSPAEILILEDVLAAVDTPIAAWICKHVLTGEIATGRTIILATHRPEFCIAAAQYTVAIENGTAVGESQTPTPLAETGANSSLPSSPIAVPVEKSSPLSPALDEKQPPDSISSSQTPRSAFQTITFYLKSAGFQMYLFGVLMTICYQALNAGHTWWLTRWTSSSDDDPNENPATILNVGLYILLSVAGVLALAVQSLVFTTVGMAASRALYEHVVERVLGATLLWIDSTPFGKLFEIIGTDMYIVDSLIAPALNGIFGTALQLGTIIVVRKLRGLLGPAAHPISDHTNAMVLGRTTIRAFGRTQFFMDRFYELVDDSSTVGIHIQIGSSWTTIRSGLLGCVFVTASTAAMVYSNIDAGTTGFTITLALQMKATLGKLLSQVSTIRMGLLAADRVIALTEVPIEPDGGTEMPNWPSQGSLEMDTVSMKYGPDMPLILKNVSFSALSHERIGIVGRTGAGKSSLTNALLRFIEPTDGEIRIDGVNTTEVALHHLRSAVKIIPQDPLLFSGTLRCNLDPGGGTTDEELATVLQRVRLIREHTPGAANSFNLEMLIEPGGTNLSHGQRQQICLARAILSQCRVLVLDEATSGMDDTTAEVIQQIIKEEFASTTVIVVAHKLLTVAGFDKILVMSHGEVCESGTPAELLAKKGMFCDMVNSSGTRGAIEAAIEHNSVDA
ncbi:hypothetical protein NLG97_g7498 [Lecanicillium saksenae]|uniref:Uncharacterized protein n=1 Tax=Lecanicillium saksenae TaxID=468837 RepID=A0ACC1QQH4_9HYPO|nr:hypothetical protein NLG97_g7498 [Lecanicillium saksenae]